MRSAHATHRPLRIAQAITKIERLANLRLVGEVKGAYGITIEVDGLERHLAVGDRCTVETRRGQQMLCEVVGIRDGRGLLMSYQDLGGVGVGCPIIVLDRGIAVRPNRGWLGRTVNGLGEPIDGKGSLPSGPLAYPLRASPPPAYFRRRVGQKLDVGVRAMNALLNLCRGQRMGIFAGSGVGKSSLLGMMARYCNADVVVIGLIGERGREVQEFIASDLGAEGTARSVVVVSTSDEPPLMRRQAAYLTLATAEYFRDQGLQVLCLMDSVTRFAMAQREIGLAAGEPPTTKGYTPSVFAELPRLLERAGPGIDGSGDITGVFTVLVDGDDHNEPIADAVRGILDGHLILDRAIAERGRYPAINLLKSVSRTMPACNTDQETALVRRVRQLLATYEDMADLIRIGAYRRGTDPKVDEAIAYFDRIDGFLSQRKDESTNLNTSYELLARLIAAPAGMKDAGIAKETAR
jgi:flagellum-specific ATP synthase